MLSLTELREFAVARHGAQLYGDRPYVGHLDAVFDLAQKYDLGKIYSRAAYGHDLLDDTRTNLDELFLNFGLLEGELIYAVSGVGKNRTERTADTLRRLHQNPDGVDLKLIDRLANLQAAVTDGKAKLVKMYLSEEEAFQPLFKKGNIEAYTDLQRLYETAKAYLEAQGQ